MLFRNRSLMIFFTIFLLTGMLFGISCGGDETASNAEEEQLSDEESQYLELWREAASALLDFTMVELEAITEDEEEEPSITELASTFQDKRDAFQAALSNLEQVSAPSSLVEYHSQIMTLYQEALDNMDSMIDAASQNDEATFVEAKARLIATLEQTTEVS